MARRSILSQLFRQSAGYVFIFGFPVRVVSKSLLCLRLHLCVDFGFGFEDLIIKKFQQLSLVFCCLKFFLHNFLVFPASAFFLYLKQ